MRVASEWSASTVVYFCPTCRWKEATLWEKVKILRRQNFPTTAEQIQDMGQSMSSFYRAALGTGPIPTLYELHKRKYIETGDSEELRRMGNHVEEVKW
jgi:hypothetical protein